MFKSKNKKSLRQGEQFQIMRTMFNKNIKNIGKNGYIGIVEGLDGETSVMESLRDEFSKTLNNYESAYEKHVSVMMSDNLSVQEFLGKCVKHKSQVYYITPKGIIRLLEKIDNETSDIQTCLKHGISITKELEVLSDEQYTVLFASKIGRPLRAALDKQSKEEYWANVQNAWNKGASYIQKSNDSTSSKIAWMDDRGYRYDFEGGLKISDLNDTWPKPNSAEYKMGVVSAEEWDILMNNPPAKKGIITKNSTCPGVEDNTESQLLSMNNKLKRLAIEMKNEINRMNNRSSNTETEIMNADNALKGIVDQLNEKRTIIKELKNEINGLDGNIVDNRNLVKSLNVHHLAWGLSFVTIIFLGIRQLKK